MPAKHTAGCDGVRLGWDDLSVNSFGKGMKLLSGWTIQSFTTIAVPEFESPGRGLGQIM